jgi:hypothetical protein
VEGILLDIARIEDNPALRQMAKLLLNRCVFGELILINPISEL